MSRKSPHRAGDALPDVTPANRPLTDTQLEFARVLGAVLAAAWAADPNCVSPALHPSLPPAGPKKF